MGPSRTNDSAILILHEAYVLINFARVIKDPEPASHLIRVHQANLQMSNRGLHMSC